MLKLLTVSVSGGFIGLELILVARPLVLDEYNLNRTALLEQLLFLAELCFKPQQHPRAKLVGWFLRALDAWALVR